MKAHFRKGKGTTPLLPRKLGLTESRGPRRGAAGGGAATQPAVELTRVQQLEAKAAREAVLAAAPKASPLTAKKFVEAISLDIDVDAARQLLLPSKGLSALPTSIGVLCQQLRKLDVSGNDLSDLSPLSSLQHLSNLNVSRNPRLASLKGLSGTCLTVLNISFCAVDSLVGLEHTALTLRTFIANDNRLQFQSPIFGGDTAALQSLVAHSISEQDDGAHDATKLADVQEACEHLPASLRAAIAPNATAMRNYAIFAACQQCETVVLSRNTQLVQGFPAWSAEELAVQCGDTPRHPTHNSGEDSGDDSSSSSASTEVPAAKEAAASRRKAMSEAPVDEEGSAMPENKQLKHVMALAHPLSVFERLLRLKKLSLSGCELHSLPSRWFLPMVTELRLAQNHLTSLQPDGVILRSLHILDISGNRFSSVITLRRCRFLEQLNVRGNPLMEKGAAQDKATAVHVQTANTTDGATTATAANPAAVPISVQQRVGRLFPRLKLLDNQPMLSVEEMRAAYKRGRDTATVEREAVAVAEAGAEDAREAHDGMDDDEVDTSAVEAKTTAQLQETQRRTSLQRHVASSTAARGLARKAPRVDPTVIAAEAEERDVVMEAPSSVVKIAHAPIIRRERVLLRPGALLTTSTGNNGTAKGADAKQKKGSGTATATAQLVLGQAAVNKLMEQSRKTAAW
jgi:Leucine-rich repeat (LRR) protein